MDIPSINPVGHYHSFRTVSQRLGHSQVSTTLDVYSHQIKQRDAAAAEDWEKYCISEKTQKRTNLQDKNCRFFNFYP